MNTTANVTAIQIDVRAPSQGPTLGTSTQIDRVTPGLAPGLQPHAVVSLWLLSSLNRPESSFQLGLLELCRARGMAHVLIGGNSCLIPPPNFSHSNQVLCTVYPESD